MKNNAKNNRLPLDEELAREGIPIVLDLRQAAKVVGRSPEVLARLARAGALRASRTPSVNGQGPWIVRRRDLAAFLLGEGARDERPC